MDTIEEQAYALNRTELTLLLAARGLTGVYLPGEKAEGLERKALIMSLQKLRTRDLISSCDVGFILEAGLAECVDLIAQATHMIVFYSEDIIKPSVCIYVKGEQIVYLVPLHTKTWLRLQKGRISTIQDDIAEFGLLPDEPLLDRVIDGNSKSRNRLLQVNIHDIKSRKNFTIEVCDDSLNRLIIRNNITLGMYSHKKLLDEIEQSMEVRE